MKVLLILTGKTDNSHISSLMEDYERRLSHYNIGFSLQVVPDLKNSRNLSESQQKNAEGGNVLKLIQPGDFVVLLDEHGKEFTSIGFAKWIESQSHTVPKRLIFVIGGPYGFSDDMYQRSNAKISLSQMTFSHQMVRLIFLEQLYRAMTIIKGEPYHHE